MDNHYEKVERLLFHKAYEELTAEEQKLVDQYLAPGLYQDIGSLGNTPKVQLPELEGALNEAYQKHYHHRKATKGRFSYAGIAALLIGLCLCSSIISWYYFSTQMMPKYINVPEIIVLRDTVYLPAPEKIAIERPRLEKPFIQKKPPSKSEAAVIMAANNDSTKLYLDKELPSLIDLPVANNVGSPSSEDTALMNALVRIY